MKEPAESWKITVLNPPYGQDAEQADLLMQFKKLRKKVMDDPKRKGVWKDFPLERPRDDISSFAIASYTDKAGQEVVLSGIRFLMASDHEYLKTIVSPSTYERVVSACPVIEKKPSKLLK